MVVICRILSNMENKKIAKKTKLPTSVRTPTTRVKKVEKKIEVAKNAPADIADDTLVDIADDTPADTVIVQHDAASDMTSNTNSSNKKEISALLDSMMDEMEKPNAANINIEFSDGEDVDVNEDVDEDEDVDTHHSPLLKPLNTLVTTSVNNPATTTPIKPTEQYVEPPTEQKVTAVQMLVASTAPSTSQPVVQPVVTPVVQPITPPVVQPVVTPTVQPTVLFYDKLATWLEQVSGVPLFDKLAGLIYGCALGDCLGLPYEGRALDDIKSMSMPAITGLPVYEHKGIKVGDWSDDTDQLILLMDHLAENYLQFNGMQFAKKLHEWKKYGFSELGDTIGLSCDSLTSRVLSKETYLKNPVLAAMTTYREMGRNVAYNGAVMRCGIASVCKNWQQVAIQQSIVTHVDNRTIYATWLVVAMCRSLLRDVIPTTDELFKNKLVFIKQQHAEEFNKYKKAYEGNTDLILEKSNLGAQDNMLFALKALGAAFYALARINEGKVTTAEDYKRIQLEVVNQGGDSDTNAAVSGQVLGSFLGYSKLPKDWIAKLVNKPWLDRKIIHFFETIIAS